jgi:hypothetical protein
LLAELSAGGSLLRVPAGFVYFLDGSIDLSSDFVDVIVDTDFMDMVSFSGRVFMLDRGAELIVVDVICVGCRCIDCDVYSAFEMRGIKLLSPKKAI